MVPVPPSRKNGRPPTHCTPAHCTPAHCTPALFTHKLRWLLIGGLWLLSHCDTSKAPPPPRPSTVTAAPKGVLPKPQPASPRPPSTPSPKQTPAATAPRTRDFALAEAHPGSVLLHYHGARIGRLKYRFSAKPAGKKLATQVREVRATTRDSDQRHFNVQADPKQATTPELHGQVTPFEQRGYAISYEVTRPATVARLVGGVELDLDLDQALPHVGVKQVHRTPRGATVELGPGLSLAVELSGPAREVRVAHRNSLTIQIDFPDRFLRTKGAKEALRIAMPAGCQLVPDFGERLAAAPTEQRPQTLRGYQSPVDLSFLNAADRPAGQHGFVRAAGDTLQFADGKSARFWGVNLVANALFRTPHAQVQSTAKRLAALGFNLVRIHHHDSDWVNPNIFTPKTDNTQSLNPASLAALDLWIHHLRNEGIYVWLDLTVGRTLRPSDQVAGRAEFAMQQDSIKALNFLNDDVERLMHDFASAYLQHKNPHTGLRYVDDPAIAAVLISNENDLVKHGLAIVDQKRFPYHGARYARFAKAFSQRHKLPLKDVMEPWQGGPGILSLSALEQEFFGRSIQHLHAIGVRVPIATSDYWGWSPLYALPSLSRGDVVDVHTYGGEAELGQDPRYSGNFLQWIGGAALLGRPVTVTEWNTPLPSRDRSSSPLFVASHAALQQWDALMIYAYNQGASFRYPDPFSTGHDPALMATMPHAALAYRRADVAPAKKHYVLELSYADLYGAHDPLRPIDLRALRTLLPQSRVSIRLPAIPELDYTPRPMAGGELVRDPQHSYIAEQATSVTSDTGELTWHLGLDAYFAIDTERTQALTGFIGGQERTLSTLHSAIEPNYGTVALSSLDGVALADSSHMLLSVVSQARENEEKRRDPEEVFVVQVVTGRVGIRSNQPHLTLFPLSPDGKRGKAVLGEPEDGVHWFTLPDVGSTFYDVQATSHAS